LKRLRPLEKERRGSTGMILIVFIFILFWSLTKTIEKVGSKITDQLQVQNDLLRKVESKLEAKNDEGSEL